MTSFSLQGNYSLPSQVVEPWVLQSLRGAEACRWILVKETSENINTFWRDKFQGSETLEVDGRVQNMLLIRVFRLDAEGQVIT